MNSLEAKIDALLTQYLGERWKTFTGCLLLAIAIGMEWAGIGSEQLIEILMLSGGILAGIGGYHKVTRSLRMSEKALAQSHEARLPREG